MVLTCSGHVLTRICTLNGTVKESELLHLYHCYNIYSQRGSEDPLCPYTTSAPSASSERPGAGSCQISTITRPDIAALRSMRVLVLTVTSRVKTWSKSITRRPHGAVASLLVNPDTHGLSQKWNFPQLPIPEAPCRLSRGVWHAACAFLAAVF